MTSSSTHLTAALVRRALQRPLPGLAAQMRMATRPRPTPDEFAHEGPQREGAVLVALYPHEGQLYLPLTRRSARLANHRGQISFPGGRQEPDDPSLWATALREAREEIGLDPQAVEPLGPLTELYIPVSHYCVHPYVGLLAARPGFVLDAREVDGLIELPLALILDEAARREQIWQLHARPTQVPYYSYAGHVIWGATAMMLSELEVLLHQALQGC